MPEWTDQASVALSGSEIDMTRSSSDQEQNVREPSDPVGEDKALPEDYAVDCLQAVPCNPTTLYVWWELGGKVGRALLERVDSDFRWVLRLAEVETGTESDVEVDPRAGNHYLHVRSGERYSIELGVTGPGGYNAVCGKTGVKMPRKQRAGDSPVNWIDLRKERESDQQKEHRARDNDRPPPTGLEWEPGLLGGSSGSQTLASREELSED
jgi:hypothetical protein